MGDRNRYRLDKRLGSGGMGDVFLATDTRLGKLVALKLLRESLASADEHDFKERFERECAICAALKSPHIVQVSDYGLTSEGYLFYVMEYLQGETLADVLVTQPHLSVARTCNIITQVCAGLQMAHEGVVLWSREVASTQQIRVIHRDLKPANIFLIPIALGELVKIIDFGIAKIHSLQAEYTSTTSVFLGTCHYASPEQFELQREVDERSDIYSLGIILYEMLAGTDPFGFNFRTERVSNEAWLMAHASKVPQSLRSHPNCDHISPHLEAVVMRCLEKSPENRFTSVAELSQALQAASSTSPNPPLPPAPPTGVKLPPTFSQASQPITPQSPATRKFPWLLAAGSAVLLALAVGTFIAPRLWQSPAPEVSQASQQKSLIDQLSLAKTFSVNSNSVWSAVLSPDGQTLISGGKDQDTARQFYPIKIWDLNSEQVSRTLDDHRKPITSLSLSGNGQIIASGSRDNTIKIWDLSTGKLIQTLEGHTKPVSSVALSRDGQTAISGSTDKTVRIWYLSNGTSRVLPKHDDWVSSVALNPNGKTLASSSKDKTIRLWDLATGELIRTLGEPGGHRDVVWAVAFSPNEKLLVSAGSDKFVKLWDSTTGNLLKTFEEDSSQVLCATFISDRVIATASFDNTIKLWDAQTGKVLQSIPAHSDQVWSLTAQLAAQTLVSSSKDKTIKTWRW